LITGAAGLIGRALQRNLIGAGFLPVPFDLRLPAGAGHGDVLDQGALRRALSGCAGVIHLAAVSRVIHGERDPRRCWATNVEGTRNVLQAALEAPARPFVLIASSREIYGQPDILPATEGTPPAPVNVYGRSKLAAEELALAARADGLRTGVLRFSNVYGCPDDHPDRVVPAFASQALAGAPLRVDGAGHVFDFTHLGDTVSGVIAAAAALASGATDLPPMHLLTGTPTTLGEMARMAIALAGSDSPVVHAPPRCYDVSRFYGDPALARRVLGWRPQTPLRDGLLGLMQAMKARAAATREAADQEFTR
jgi:nucleoside-diphosphate-sugar epimerase